MVNRVCIVGLDEPEYTQIRQCVNLRVIAHELLPRVVVKDGQLLVEPKRGPGLVPVSKIVFHSIYEDDLDFIAALALWGGPCLPNAFGMMNCRLKLPGLVHALRHTRFGAPLRGYAGPGAVFETEIDSVAKWGNWHCGENKARFVTSWQSAQACIVENFLSGQAVRVVIIGDQYWQIKLEGETWLKSIHSTHASFMEVDAELLEDTRNLQKAFGLEIIANDYIVTDQGTKHLLEVNHIPNVTRFPEIWEVYRDYVVEWLQIPVQV